MHKDLHTSPLLLFPVTSAGHIETLILIVCMQMLHMRAFRLSSLVVVTPI